MSPIALAFQAWNASMSASGMEQLMKNSSLRRVRPVLPFRTAGLRDTDVFVSFKTLFLVDGSSLVGGWVGCGQCCVVEWFKPINNENISIVS